MLKRNIVANYAGTVWNVVISLAFVPLYVKYLGTESFGLVGVSVLLNAYMAFFTVGLSPMFGREAARFQGGFHSPTSIVSLLRVVELTVGGIGAMCVATLWLSAPLVASSWLKTDIISDESTAHALRILSLVVGIRFFEGLYTSALIGLQRQVTANILSSAAATLRGVGSLAVLAWWSPTVDAFFWWQGCVACASALVFRKSTYANLPYAHISLRQGVALLREGWPFARGMLLGSFLTLCVTQTDKLLLTRLLNLSDYGRYTLAVSIGASLALLTIPIHHTFFPRFTELLSQGNKSDAAREFHHSAQLVSVVTGSTGIVLALFSDRLVLLWTGDRALAATIASPLTLMLLGYLCNALVAMPYALQLGAGRTALSNWLGAASVVIMVPALVLIVPRSGIMGAASVWLCFSAANTTLFVPILFSNLGIVQLRQWIIEDVAAPLCAAFVPAALVWLASAAIADTRLASAAILPSALIASTIASLLCANALRNRTASIVTRILNRPGRSSGGR